MLVLLNCFEFAYVILKLDDIKFKLKLKSSKLHELQA